MRSGLTAVLAVCVAVILLTACRGNSGPAKISKLAIGKNLAADLAVSSFDIKDVIYAVATVTNAKAKYNINFEVTAEDVVARSKGDHLMNKSVDFEDDGTEFLQFSVAYPGEYKIEATLSDANGSRIDSKSGNITVTGEPAPLETEHEPGMDGDRDKDRNKDKLKEPGNDKDKDKNKEKDKDRGRQSPPKNTPR